MSFSMLAQEVPSLEPKIGAEYNFIAKTELWSTCDSLNMGLFPKGTYTQEEWDVLDNKCEAIGYSEACGDLWSIICGSDWVDGGYDRQATIDKNGNPHWEDLAIASSALKPQKGNNYNNKNIYDLRYDTAWIEGVKGYGIGEYVEFNFPPKHPRITTIKIANGYIKDKSTWKNNSRVKQLKVCLNNQDFVILNLKDVYAEQVFEIPTIGYEIRYRGLNDDGTSWYSYTDRNGKTIKSYTKKIDSGDTIRFEIMRIYKGDKYDDTAITEIYFDGLDVY